MTVSPSPSPSSFQPAKQQPFVPPQWITDFLRLEWLRDFLAFSWVDDVLSSPVWAGISGIAGVLSLIAIVLALHDFRTRKQRVEGVHWEVESYAQGTLPEPATPRHLEILKLTQAGSSAVRIYSWSIVEGVTHRDETYDVPWHIKPGEPVQVAIQTNTPETAWFLLIWMDLTDKRWFYAEWFPLAENAEGNRSDQKTRSHEETVPGRRWKFWQSRSHAMPVGPTGAGRVRFSANPKTLGRDIVKVLDLVSKSPQRISVMPALRKVTTAVPPLEASVAGN